MEKELIMIAICGEINLILVKIKRGSNKTEALKKIPFDW